MDEAVVKPETDGLAPGWTASMMGMMTLVKVLPPAQHDEMTARIRDGRLDETVPAGGEHEHE